MVDIFAKSTCNDLPLYCDKKCHITVVVLTQYVRIYLLDTKLVLFHLYQSYIIRSSVKETRPDNMIKKSGIWLNTRPDFEPEGSGAGRVGFDFLGVGFFRLGSPMGGKMVGRIEFQIFEFFDHASGYLLL